MIHPESIITAYNRVAAILPSTPLVSSSYLNELLGHNIFFKMEALQKTGSIKVRGAINALYSLLEQNLLPKMVSAYSSGNHGLALSWITQVLGIKLNLYIPPFTPQIKQNIARSYGANVIVTSTREEAEFLAKEDAKKDGCIFLSPSDNDDVIAGAATCFYEAFLEAKSFDAIFVPCGGGGLVAGAYLAAQLFSPLCKIFAAEPLRANDAAISKRNGSIFRFKQSPDTIADGARTLGITPRTFEYIKLIEEIYEIPDRDMIYWTIWINHLLNIRTEFTSNLASAAAYRWLKNQTEPKKVLILISGGNLDEQLYSQYYNPEYLEILPDNFNHDQE